jgi:hypothetical protein
MVKEILVKQNMLPVKIANKFTFAKGRNRSFLDIMSASHKALFHHKKTRIPQIYNASDHAYVTGEITTKASVRDLEWPPADGRDSLCQPDAFLGHDDRPGSTYY